MIQSWGGLLYNNKKEQVKVPHKVDSHKHKIKKPATEEHVLYDSSYIKFKTSHNDSVKSQDKGVPLGRKERVVIMIIMSGDF